MATFSRYVAAGRAVTRDAIFWRPGDQTSEDTYLVARTLHRTTGGVSSRAALALIRAVHDRSRAGGAALSGGWADALPATRRDGVSFVPPVLDADAVARVREFAATAPAVLTSVSNENRRGTFEQRDPGTAAVHIVESFVLDQPDIQSIVAGSGISAFARAYFGADPVIHPPQLYWSCAGARLTKEAAANSARQFHWDYDGLAGLRLHLYLTDVDDGAAPMAYVVGSHRQGGLRSPALRRADLGVPDADVWQSYPRSALRTVTGPAGTTFVSDSRGLHRGNDAVTTDRLFLVMPLQATGFAGYQLRPRSIEPADPVLTKGIASGRPEFSLFRARTRPRVAGTR